MKFKIKYFKTIKDEMSLSFDDKDNIVTLIGLNGSGKTNILEAISHIKYNKNENDIWTHPDLENRDKLEVRYIESTNDIENTEINNFLKKFDIKIDPTIDRKKYFLKTINTLFSENYKSSHYLFELLNNIKVNIFSKYEEQYKDIKFLNESIVGDNKIYDVNKTKVKLLSVVNENDSKFLSSLGEEIEKIKTIFNKTNLEVLYIADAENDNNIDVTYDFHKYESDSQTKNVIDFFIEDAKDKIDKMIYYNDGTDTGLMQIDVIKEKIRESTKKKMAQIFRELDIYAEPRIEIDGNTLKVFVNHKNNYKIKNNISTANNSSGYKSIIWLLLNLEAVIHYSKKWQRNYLFILDEPDKNIHPILQQQMIHYIDKRINGTRVKVILSTHSPFLIDEKCKILVVSRDKDGDTKVSNTKSQKFSSIFPKIMFDQLNLSQITKHGYKKNILFVIQRKWIDQDKISELKQYISERNPKQPFSIELINPNNIIDIQYISSLEQMDNKVQLKPNKGPYYVDLPQEEWKKMIDSNEKTNK
ncbi:MAG: AAA family ATPase [Metamycoplasmataceae bacterium]